MRNAAKRAQCARAFPMPRERDEEMVVAMAWSAMEREIVSLTLQTEMQGARLVQMDEEVKAMHRKTDEFRRRLLETDCTHREAIEWYTDQTKTLEHRNTLLETHLHETLLARPPAGAEQVKASNVTWCKGEPGEFKHAQKAPTAEAAVGAVDETFRPSHGVAKVHMLVEVRMRKAGTMGGSGSSAAPKKKAVRPAKFGSKFEEVLFDKPAVKALYEELQAAKDINAMNLVSEHINNVKRAKDRYGNVPNYGATIKRVEEAMTARIVQEVTTPTVLYSGAQYDLERLTAYYRLLTTDY